MYFRFFTEVTLGHNIKIVKKLTILVGTKSISDNSTGCHFRIYPCVFFCVYKVSIPKDRKGNLDIKLL